jgi:pimeloyl-ACP methyl ester carboxylesterase
MQTRVSTSTEAAFREAYDAMLRLWTMPSEPRDVTSADGARTHVQVWGRADAPPLVLLHGFQVTSTMWAPNAAALGAVRRCYAPDTLGDFGWSQPARPPRALDDLCAWLESLLDALGLDRVDLGGMSYGGWLAANLAARRPARVNKLVLLAPGASFAGFSAAFVLRGLPMIAFKQRRFVDAYLRWAAVPPAGDDHYEAWMSALVDVMFTGIRHFGGLRLPLPKRLPPEVMRAIAAPTLLVYGEQEKMYAAPRAVAVARAHVAKLETLLVPDASHDLTIGQAARVNDAVAQFLG